MLNTQEVDDDFFTPVASTSLANIFGDSAMSKESTVNDSLKYIPPKPQNVVPQKKEQAKATECIFACALNAHEWCDGVYTPRGKLGFAILKIQKTGDYNIVLYDSNKTTLSSATISTKFVVTINDTYISYFDSLQKYWSIYGSEDDTKKITEVLKSCGVNIRYNTNKEKGPPKPKSENETNATYEDSESNLQKNIESDTDSSVNRKTKASILSRMANMGHSVLPMRTLPVDKSSDSSDSNQIENQSKSVRHKLVKTIIKKNSVENVALESHQNIIGTKIESPRNVNTCDSQLMPIANASVFTSTNNELGMFMSEQRISNSELRINMNRITDKVDSVLDKLKSLENKDNRTNVSSDILLKLLTEYENKIKAYEELLKSREVCNKNVIEDKCSVSEKEVELLKNTIVEIRKENENKNLEINNLQTELNLVKNKYIEENQSKESEFLSRINRLQEELKLKNKELNDCINNSHALGTHTDNIGEKVKNIMNNTFQTISVNFENHENYSGETIKRIIGTVIRKITIESLNEL